MYNELGIIRKALFCTVHRVQYFTLKTSKIALLNPFCDESLHIIMLHFASYVQYIENVKFRVERIAPYNFRFPSVINRMCTLIIT